MILFGKDKTEMVSAERGAPGPRGDDAGPGASRRARHADRAAVPGRARAARRRAWAASGAPSASSGRRRASSRRRSATRAASRRTRPTRRSAAAAPATPKRCSRSSIPRRPRTRRCCASSGRTTTRRRACARETTAARSTARRSTGRTTRSGRPPRRRAPCTSASSARSGLRRDHDRARRRRAVLLRRALPPAVPGEESERLLRPRRHGRRVPCRPARREALRHRATRPVTICSMTGEPLVSVITPVRRRPRSSPPASLPCCADAPAGPVRDRDRRRRSSAGAARGARLDRRRADPRGTGAPKTSYAARNRAAANTRGDVLAFCDSDCLPEPRWLEAGLAALENADIVAGEVAFMPPARPTGLVASDDRHVPRPGAERAPVEGRDREPVRPARTLRAGR